MRSGERAKRKGKLKNFTRYFDSVKCFLSIFSRHFSFPKASPMLPITIKDIPTRPKNQALIPPSTVGEKDQQTHPMTTKMSPQMEAMMPVVLQP